MQKKIKSKIFKLDGAQGETLISYSLEHAVNYPNTPINFYTLDLTEKIANKSNLLKAFHKVKANKGAPGIDKVTIEQVHGNLDEVLENLQQCLMDGSFKPTPVRRAEIPKKTGGSRQLGIPIVTDRVVQQAICNIIDPLFDRNFASGSFGFRKGKSCHMAVKKAQSFIEDGYKVAISIDLQHCFDMINHDLLINQLRKVISDKRVIRIIAKFLRAGIMVDGKVTPSTLGTPQGGSLSPLLTNIYLNQLDKELEKRGHKFVRYADDILIFVRTPRAATRVFASISKFIEIKLRLPINTDKSKISALYTSYLGFRLKCDGQISIAKENIANLKNKVRFITKRNRAWSIKFIIKMLNRVIRGWFHYFKIASAKRVFRELDSWMRRRLRTKILKYCKRKRTVFKRLKRRISSSSAAAIAFSHKGIWRLSKSSPMHKAYRNRYFFKYLNLFCLYRQYVKSL